MTVRRREGVWYVDFRYPDPTTGTSKRFKRSTGRGTTKKEALELERRWWLEAMAPAAPPESPVKRAAFSGFAKRWLDTYIKTNRKHSYYRSTEQILRCHLVPFFGNQDLRSIDQEQVALYKAAKIDGTASVVGKRTKTVLMAKTVNNHIGVISILFEKAVDWGYCERNPVTGVGLLRLPPQEFKFWDREQSDAFLGALLETEPEYFPLFLCALRTGMRQGELFALRWDDLDFVKRQLRVVWNWTHGKLDSPKGGRGRSIPMSAELGHVLHEHRHLRGPLVFCREGGGYLSGDVVKHPFNRATRKAGVERIRFHDMRHSFASQLVMAGVPLKAVQEYLGHADLSMTMRYAHLSPTAKQDFIACLDSGVPERMCGAAWSQIGPNSGPAMMAGRKRALEN